MAARLVILEGLLVTAPAQQKKSVNFPQIVLVNLAVNSAVDFVMNFSTSFNPLLKGLNGHEIFVLKFAQEFAPKFVPPCGKIRAEFVLQDDLTNFSEGP